MSSDDEDVAPRSKPTATVTPEGSESEPDDAEEEEKKV